MLACSKIQRQYTLRMSLKLNCLLWLVLACGTGIGQAASLPEYAATFKQQLREKIMPYWHNTAVDRAKGGYLLADDGSGGRQARDKQLVTQSRMVWGFSHAHVKGLGTNNLNYLRSAEYGYRFLLEHFRDKDNGGYFWTTDLDGKVLNDSKILYGQCFVIYAMVEFYRAGGDRKALEHAMELFHVIQKNAHDAKNKGWIEHFTKDWQPILANDGRAIVERGGCKSANTHLHWMEALTELYMVTRDIEVKKALEEAVELNRQYFYPANPGKSCFHRHLDWKPTTGPSSAGLSYGHNVEFAWLMIHAQNALGEKPAWNHFYAHLDHALKYGYDWVNGGLYYRGYDDKPARVTDKVWWAEAELIAALSDALQQKENPAYRAALTKQIEFLLQYQIDPSDGIWRDTVTADGKPKTPAKAHNWKANYHDVRALMKFCETFSR